MEIKSRLLKPYTRQQKLDFLSEYNYKLGCDIRETSEALEAWGYTKEESERIAKQREIEERVAYLKDFLNNSDYVVIKLYETFMNNPSEYESLKALYTPIMQQRAEAREEINQLENND